MQAEINVLVQSYKELFPANNIISEFDMVLGLPTKDLAMMHIFIYKDNVCVLALADTISPQVTSQRK